MIHRHQVCERKRQRSPAFGGTVFGGVIGRSRTTNQEAPDPVPDRRRRQREVSAYRAIAPAGGRPGERCSDHLDAVKTPQQGAVRKDDVSALASGATSPARPDPFQPRPIAYPTAPGVAPEPQPAITSRTAQLARHQVVSNALSWCFGEDQRASNHSWRCHAVAAPPSWREEGDEVHHSGISLGPRMCRDLRGTTKRQKAGARHVSSAPASRRAQGAAPAAHIGGCEIGLW